MQVLLIGQPELAQRLNEPELRQLKQRIALRCSLEPMTLRETASYIAGRIRIAGGDAPKVFTRDAVQEIYERTKGIPRLVSVVCDNALVTGFANGVAPVDRQVIVGVCRDFDFGPARSTQDGAPEIVMVTPKEPEPVPEAEPPQPSEQKIAESKPASSPMFSLFGKTRSGGRG
jgi:general secretion pathway protein A